jgi:uncharacterized protein YbjQ (UPF0145 family)
MIARARTMNADAIVSIRFSTSMVMVGAASFWFMERL